MDLQEIVDAYGASWNEADEDKRRKLLEQSWADDGVFLDPQGRVEGREALAAHIGGFQQVFQRHTIDASSGIDTYGDVFRFTWVIKNAQGESTLEGIDFGEIAADGRIKSITGFWGPIPEI